MPRELPSHQRFPGPPPPYRASRGRSQEAPGEPERLPRGLVPPGDCTAYSGDFGRPVRRDAGRPFRLMAARVGAQRRWALGYLSQVADGVKFARG